jgi:hypothetical protein
VDKLYEHDNQRVKDKKFLESFGKKGECWKQRQTLSRKEERIDKFYIFGQFRLTFAKFKIFFCVRLFYIDFFILANINLINSFTF